MHYAEHRGAAEGAEHEGPAGGAQEAPRGVGEDLMSVQVSGCPPFIPSKTHNIPRHLLTAP